MSEEEINYNENDDMQNNDIEQNVSASSEKTTSAFGGLRESLQNGDAQGTHSRSPKNSAKSKVGSAAMQVMGIPKPIANIAANRLANRKGNQENLPEALKKRKNGIPNSKNTEKGSGNEKANTSTGGASGLESQIGGTSDQKTNGNEKGAVQKTAEKAVEKGGSAAIQAAGIPKPIADMIAKKVSGPTTKIIIISIVLSILLFCLIVIALIVSVTVFFEPLIQGFEEVSKSMGQIQYNYIGLLDIKTANLTNNRLLILNNSDSNDIIQNDNSYKSKTEIQREQFHATLRELAKDERYKNIQWNIALASVLYGVSSERDIYDGYCEIEFLETCIKWDKDPSMDFKDAESNLKRIVKKLKRGKSEYEKYMLETYIPKYFSKKMEKENKTAEDILQEIYKMAAIVGELFPDISYSYISNICPGGINVLPGSNSTRFPGANNLSLEEYVAGSLSSEYSGANSSASETELMKAMAIAIRSNIVKKVKGTADDNGVCTVINSTNFQTYREPTERTLTVTQETAGQVLMYNDDVMMLHYSIFPGKDADGWSSSTPCENSVCSGGMCTATLYKDPGNEKVTFTVPQSYSGYTDVSKINNSHCHGLSTIVASYYASSQSLTHDKIINLFVSDGVTISQLTSGEQMLPLEFKDPTKWRDNTSRIYQIGNAGCYRNGVLVGNNCSHLGIDFTYGGINGKPVYAFAPGVVIESTYNDGGYGYTVKLGHDIDGDGKYDYYSRYGHMQNSLTVSTGDIVAAGVQLGVVGSTGNSTGPHLHFEIYSSAGRSVEDYYNTRPDLMMDRIAEGKTWYES